jgi:hypothetical protein
MELGKNLGSTTQTLNPMYMKQSEIINHDLCPFVMGDVE